MISKNFHGLNQYAAHADGSATNGSKKSITSSEVELKQRFEDSVTSIFQQIEFVDLESLALTLCAPDITELKNQLANLETDRRVLAVEVDGVHLYPRFQFTSEGDVIPLLSQWLPALLKGRNHWFVLQWLCTETSVLMVRAKAWQDQIDQALNDFTKYDELVMMEAEQSRILTVRPIDLLLDAREDEFVAFCQEHLDPDARQIKTVALKGL